MTMTILASKTNTIRKTRAGYNDPEHVDEARTRSKEEVHL
jgi:hypothetical protein